ncbi:MAG: MaoC family dehydratase N-terminal domain-containing protein [Alphaproteobacteria bacterium]|nr:MaoC family dehydratase N-terminal domain-containing protein [Alphaproteobacteria bacterium]MBV9061533.1 MaoC family dehydratase N-terminal domain-containing protein [Alphaproteobacteria bacterium]
MIDIAHLKSWIGRTAEATDVAAPGPLTRLAALLDHEALPWILDQLPPLAHWLYFLPDARQSELDSDGHPKRGDFLPPVPSPRRMWAGSRLEFRAPIRIGTAMTKTSTIAAVEAKSGVSGEMVFVTIRHEISAAADVAVVEEQDIVYREPPNASAASAGSRAPAAEERIPEWRRTITPDPVQLFRYSALTFNSHRIHYDREYCRDVEGYPGLVVHGPYIATLLADHFLRQHPRTPLAKLRFRAHRPLFDTAPFDLCGCRAEGGADLWARGPSGEIATFMTVALAK